MRFFRPAALARLASFGLTLLPGIGCDGASTPALEPPRLTQLFSGKVEMLGDGSSTCSHQPAAAQAPSQAPRIDRWCAFAREKGKGNSAELWVVNLDRARAGQAPCDGSSPNCVMLTDALWTGDPVFSPAYPYVHGFYGDTLFFYTDSSTGNTDQAFEGTIQAWRPGMKAGRALSGAKGYFCFGHERASSAVCLSNQGRGGGALEFDLLAGPVEGGPVGPLTLIERIRPYDPDGTLVWGAQFAPTGATFAFSTKVGMDAAGKPMQALRIVPSAELGQTAPREIIRDVQQWGFSPDGKKLLFMRDIVTDEFGATAGTLTMADFPSGENVVPLAPKVARYELYGDATEGLKGIGIYEGGAGEGTFRIMRDPSRPAELVTIGNQIEDALVSPDLRYSFFHSSNDAGDTISVIARNDASGTRCVLNRNAGQGAFSVRFLPKLNKVIWAEDASGGSSFGYEGYYADPETCQGGGRFTTKLGYYDSSAEGLLFGETDAAGFTMELKHARFDKGEIKPDAVVSIAKRTGLTVSFVDRRFVVFSMGESADSAGGLFVYGPVP